MVFSTFLTDRNFHINFRRLRYRVLVWRAQHKSVGATMVLLLLLFFVIGAVAVVAMEAVGLWILIQRLNRKIKREDIQDKAAASVSFSEDVSPSSYDKQGVLWVLEPEKVPKSGFEDKVPMEQRRRKDIFEVTPVQKFARIKDHCLTLTESDGSCVKILLRGCKIAAVSATSLSSRKWAKRYPVKVESKDSVIYKGYGIIYIYLETSWEKESWCKALRFASCVDEEKNLWTSKLSAEFQKYLASLSAGYPSVMKPSAGGTGLMVKSVKLDNSSSKVRQFLKKLAKKTPKSGEDYKASSPSIPGHEERKIREKTRSFQESILANSLAKMVPTGKPTQVSFDDTSVASSISTSTEPGGRNHLSGVSEADSDFKNFDEGTLCLNLLISRLFFDFKSNMQIRSSIQHRIQRALSNIRVPNYIGEVTCTSVDPGTLPPRIHAMRVLPSNVNEVWALEIDLEYLGGTILDIETRLEVRELELEGEEIRFDSNTVGEVPSDLLEGFEYLGKHLELSEETMDSSKQKDEVSHGSDESDIPKSTARASSQGSRWKSMLHSITKQVSQVPLSLGITVSSVRGTMRLYMKPPPSDQIWFGFTSMPDIDLSLESSVGEHKITSGHFALFLISRFKASIRETLVLPNSESICIPWMLADKDDWVPRNVAPFMWYKSNHDSVSNTTRREVPSLQPGEVTHSVEANHGIPPRPEVNPEKSKNVGHVPQSTCKSLDPCASSSSSLDDSVGNDSSFQELRAPLVKKDGLQEFGPRSKEGKLDTHVSTRSLEFTDGQIIHNTEDDDARPRRVGTRERMLGLGKKMGEKLEVKRRHFEEKGRSFVERMRAP